MKLYVVKVTASKIYILFILKFLKLTGPIYSETYLISIDSNIIYQP